jgi:hypothetical protein
MAGRRAPCTSERHRTGWSRHRPDVSFGVRFACIPIVRCLHLTASIRVAKVRPLSQVE